VEALRVAEVPALDLGVALPELVAAVLLVNGEAVVVPEALGAGAVAAPAPGGEVPTKVYEVLPIQPVALALAPLLAIVIGADWLNLPRLSLTSKTIIPGAMSTSQETSVALVAGKSKRAAAPAVGGKMLRRKGAFPLFVHERK